MKYTTEFMIKLRDILFMKMVCFEVAGLALHHRRNLGSKTVQRIIVTAATVLLGAGLAITTAKAEMNYGPVLDPAKGLCFKRQTNYESGTFGYWTACPKTTTAAAASAAPVNHRHAKPGEKDAQQAQ
jgi:hypothetical protein